MFTAPENRTYDGNGKTVTVEFNTEDGKLTGMGNITVKYQKSGESTWSDTAPKDAGTYKVAISVAEGQNYEGANELTTATLGWWTIFRRAKASRRKPISKTAAPQTK